MRKLTLQILAVFSAITLCACAGGTSEDTAGTEAEPKLSQLKSICTLATLKCYYHNVAKSTKTAGTGLAHWGEVDRKFWTEYDGEIKLGVDMSKGDMEVKGDTVIIYMPEAELLSIKPDDTSMQVPIVDLDSWNPNEITADDVTQAIRDAEAQIEQSIMENSTLLTNARDKAMLLIENYIDQLGEMTGTKYKIEFRDVTDTTPTDSFTDESEEQ